MKSRLRLILLIVWGTVMMNGRQVHASYPTPKSYYNRPPAPIYNSSPAPVYRPPSPVYYPLTVPTASEYENYNECVRMMEKYKHTRNTLGYNDLESSHYMVPDQAILDLASDSGYDYFHTATDNSRSASRTGKATNFELVNSEENENSDSGRTKRWANIDVQPNSNSNFNNAVKERYGLQPTYPTQSSHPTQIQIDYTCNDEGLFWTEIDPHSKKIYKYNRYYDDEAGTMHYHMATDNHHVNYVFSNEHVKGGKKGLAAAIAVPIAVGVPLAALGVAGATLGAVALTGSIGFALISATAIALTVAAVAAVGLVGLSLGAVAFVLVTGTAVATLGTSITLGVLGIVKGLKNKGKKCPKPSEILPCTCTVIRSDNGQNTISITCPQGITVQQIQSAFNRMVQEKKIGTLVLNLPPGTNALPANLLGKHRASVIQLIGPPPNAGVLSTLTIDQNAFHKTAPFTTLFILQQFNLANINFNFLTGFDALVMIQVIKSTNLQQPPNLPTLPSLKEFLVDGTNIFPIGRSSRSLQNFTKLSRGLTKLTLTNSSMTDEDVSLYLDWVLPSSKDTLQELNLDFNSLTKIPDQISSFVVLNSLSIKGQEPEDGSFKIGQGSFEFKHLLEKPIDLSANKIKSIEPGSFKGNYTRTPVILSGNQLSRFEDTVFENMLLQMKTTNDPSVTFVDVDKNPFDCESDPCHLAWLLKGNRELLKFVKNANCSNNTKFEDIDSSKFTNCSIKAPSQSGYKFAVRNIRG